MLLAVKPSLNLFFAQPQHVMSFMCSAVSPTKGGNSNNYCSSDSLWQHLKKGTKLKEKKKITDKHYLYQSFVTEPLSPLHPQNLSPITPANQTAAFLR